MILECQKNDVYKWEQCNVMPFDRTAISIHSVQNIINWIWKDMGLKHPPKVELLRKNAKQAGEANRMVVRLHELTYTWIVIHELAHSMTSIAAGGCNYHDADFLGIYMKMLNKYMKIPMEKLCSTAKEFGLRYNMDIVPYCIDPNIQHADLLKGKCYV